jgi:signal transduction histidine kinase
MDDIGREQLRQQFEGGKPWGGLELQMKRRDGTAISVRLSGRVVSDEAGHRLYCECIAEDVTERRALEQQLRQAQKMEAVGRLAGGVAHDFNNLLTVIKGYTEIVREDLGSSYPHRQELEEALNAAERAATLTRQLLAFSRQQVMAPRIVNVNSVVNNMQNLLTRLLGEDVHLEINLDPKLGSVKADPSQFEQVIMNLAVNARHAMPNGGKLRLETANIELEEDWAREHMGAHAGRYVVLSITDTGSGMDEKTKARLFEPFFTTKEQGKGTGLGLSTVYGIVKQSGGYISVYSEVGVGSTFKIYLPRLDAAAEALATAATPAPANRGWETVLLVEDEDGVRRLVRDLITRQGYKVLEARSGEEALELVRQGAARIDLLLTDLVLANMSGRELSERLRAERKELKVLYMSGYTDDAVLHAGMLTQGASFIQKPFTATLLAQKMRELLDPPAARA